MFLRPVARVVTRQTLGRPCNRCYATSWQPAQFANEELKAYGRNSQERAELVTALAELKTHLPAKISLECNGTVINDRLTATQSNPSHRTAVVAQYAEATTNNVNDCIDASVNAASSWSILPFRERAKVFLRAADQHPFGGSRASGTNDKAGTMGLLMRWTSPRTIKRQLAKTERVLYESNEV